MRRPASAELPTTAIKKWAKVLGMALELEANSCVNMVYHGTILLASMSAMRSLTRSIYLMQVYSAAGPALAMGVIWSRRSSSWSRRTRMARSISTQRNTHTRLSNPVHLIYTGTSMRPAGSSANCALAMMIRPRISSPLFSASSMHQDASLYRGRKN